MNDRKEHPMTAVPDAIRIVLSEAARLCCLPSTDNDNNNNNNNNSNMRPTETVVLQDVASVTTLMGRTLATDVTMREPGYPPYQASIMDGFAIRTSECDSKNLSSETGWTHAVIDKIFAGSETQPKSSSTNGDDSQLASAYYVTTGAIVPGDFNCVVPIEECRVATDSSKIAISSTSSIQERKWIRQVGCDISAGSVVLPAGHVLDGVAIGLLYQSGRAQVELCRPVTVGVLSTGTELVSASNGGGSDSDAAGWDQMRTGTIPDVNRPILLSLLSTFGSCTPVDLGRARDDNVESMTAAIESALPECDVIITTGGISMGETDVVEHVLVERLKGHLHFGRMHMKPGKPTTFVTIPSLKGTRLVFAMPGNPVSAIVCTQLLVRPCLDLLFSRPDRSADTDGDSVEECIRNMVSNAWVHPEVQVKLAHDLQLDAERPEYHRVTLQMSADGSYQALSTGIQRSSRLVSLRDAEGLLVLPQASSDKSKALAGETYTLLLLRDQAKKIQLRDSLHLNKKTSKSLKVAIVQVASPHQGSDARVVDISDRTKNALSGSKSGSVSIVSSRVYAGPVNAGPGLDYFGSGSNSVLLAEEDDADIIVISCCKFDGSFRYHAELAQKLRTTLVKVADAMALQARRGAASQDPTMAVFEVVVGLSPTGSGPIVIMLPEEGLDGGLGNVRGLLKHALKIARG
jgi:molybdenum cofactor synthesis domain-containing protein